MLALASVGVVMIGYATLLFFMVSRAPQRSSEPTAAAYLLAGAGLSFGVGAALLLAAVKPGARTYALRLALALLVCDLVRKLFFGRWLKRSA